MPDIVIPEQTEPSKSYDPNTKKRDTLEFLSKRVEKMKEYRKQKLRNNTKSIEDIWNEAEKEYQPHELTTEGKTRLVSDEDTGLRSRLVKLGDDSGWQSDMASPDFYVKVNTAIAILIDQNPEAVFIPDSKRFEKNTKLAYGNWKHSWEVSGAKQQLKNFVFNMSKYGTGFFRTYPKLVRMKKQIRTEYYPDQPEKDVYESKTVIKFNDLCRESYNPQQVWLSELTRPGDYSSMDDCYIEVDFSQDKFNQVFADYKDSKYAKPDATSAGGDAVQADNQTNENITVGFYENQVLDIYAVWIPSQKVLLYQSPLPNDDGLLSLTFAPWTLRDDRCPYGIGLWEILRNDSVLYDRMLNMTMDQLTLAIYKMAFYQGTQILGENGQLVVRPGGLEQTSDAKGVTFMEVPGPGQEAWTGLDFLQERKDRISGVIQQLTGQSGNKTLGQDLQSKESALERMKAPLDYILDALQQEAYITLSWQKQILSTPEVLEYTDDETLKGALKEVGMADEDIAKYLQEAASPQHGTDLVFGNQPSEGEPQRKFANVYREVPYNMEKDDKGELIESKEQQFYRFGTDLPLHHLDWKGIIRIKPQSVLAPSKELTRRMKLDLFNLVYPAMQTMLAMPINIPLLLPGIEQIVKVYEEDVSDWFDKDALMAMADAAKQPPPPPPPDPPKLSISIKFETLIPEVQQQMLEMYAGIKPPAPPAPEAPPEQSLFIDAKTGAPHNPGAGQAGPPPQAGPPQGQTPSQNPTQPQQNAQPPVMQPLVPPSNLSGGRNPGMQMSQKAGQGMKIIK